MIFFPYPFLVCPTSVPSIDNVGFNLEQYNQLYSNIHKMEFSAFINIITDTFAQNVGADGFLSLNFNDSGDVNIAGFGSTKRSLSSSGNLDANGNLIPATKGVSFPGEAPIHSGGGNGVFAIIDIGKCFQKGGLIFPFISINLGGQASNTIGSDLIGSIDFIDYGTIPIYVENLPDNALIAIAGGSLKVTQTYDMLDASPKRVSVGDTITISPLINPETNQPYQFDGLNLVQEVYFGPFKVDANISSSQITFTVPVNAKTGYITFISYSPNYNKWKTSYPITMI